MKKLTAILAATFLFTVASQAQDTTGHRFHDRARAGQRGAMEQLNLSADQKAQLKAFREGNKARLDEIRNNSNLTSEQKRIQLETWRKEQREKMQSILTTDQQAKLAEFRKNHPQMDQRNGQAFRRFGRANVNPDSLRRNLTPEQKEKLARFRKNREGADSTRARRFNGNGFNHPRR